MDLDVIELLSEYSLPPNHIFPPPTPLVGSWSFCSSFAPDSPHFIFYQSWFLPPRMRGWGGSLPVCIRLSFFLPSCFELWNSSSPRVIPSASQSALTNILSLFPLEKVPTEGLNFIPHHTSPPSREPFQTRLIANVHRTQSSSQNKFVLACDCRGQRHWCSIVIVCLAVPLPALQRRQPHQPGGVGPQHRGPPAPRQGEQQVLQAGQISSLGLESTLHSLRIEDWGGEDLFCHKKSGALKREENWITSRVWWKNGWGAFYGERCIYHARVSRRESVEIRRKSRWCQVLQNETRTKMWYWPDLKQIDRDEHTRSGVWVVGYQD